MAIRVHIEISVYIPQERRCGATAVRDMGNGAA